MDLNAKTKKENDVADDYLSSLSDLNCNSKPLINMLTMLAEENIEYAAVIVKVVDQHIAKVPVDFKLPILYLIDSIVKNVKGTYVQLFSQCIVNIFCGVFEKVNEKVRERMYALRQTWNEVFLTQKLYALDVKVKRIDNNWPITAKQPSIHVNPNFLKTVSAGQAAALPTDMEEILHAKTRELLELKKRKLELELEATKKHLEEQTKQLTKTTESVIPPVDALVASNPLPLSSGHVRAHAQMMPPGQQHPGMRPAGMYHNRNPRPPSHLVAPGMLNMPPQQGYPSMINMGKPKVHPVNPALLNTIRHRDPRLARQQQQQQQQLQLVQAGRNVNAADAEQIQSARGVGTTTSQSSAATALLTTKSEGGKSSILSLSISSTSSYRSSSSKSSRSGGSGGSSEGKASTRHSSSRSVGSASSSSKSKTSRSSDKDTEQRKRSESKSSTTSSSSTGSGSSSSSTERRKNKYQLAVKCDKDAFEIAPLSATFKRKSSSPPGGLSPTKTKDAKRSSKSRNYVADDDSTSRSKARRSRSPSPEVLADGGSRSPDAFANVADAVVSASPEKRIKLADTKREEAPPSPPTITSTAAAPSASKDLDKNIENVLEPMVSHLPISSMMDVDLRQQLTPAAAAAAFTPAVVVRETSRTKTVATSSPKVSFKIQKLFNKLEKSTEHLSTASFASTTTSTSAAAKDVNALNVAAVVATNTSFKAPQLTRRKTNNECADEEEHISVMSDKLTNCKLPELEPMTVDSNVNNDDDGKKRPSATQEPEEPLAKKSKSAKFETLFGSEDVDLRSLMPPQILAAHQHQQRAASLSEDEICPPPPPLITKDKESPSQHNNENRDNPKTSKSSSPSLINAATVSPCKKSSLDDVRAKLARQTAKYNKFGKFEKFNRELSQRFKLAELNQNEDTQEANDEKIRTIITQAQELLQSNSINQEQYRNLVQTVMSINETNKLKEAKRRDSVNTAVPSSSPPPKALKMSSSPLPSPTRKNDEDQQSSAAATEEESISDAERNAREAVLKKRIPKLPKTSAAALETKPCGSPISDGCGGGNDSPLYDSPNDEGIAGKTNKEKRSKEKRLKKQTKWGERIDPATANNNLIATASEGALLPPRVWPTAAHSNFRGSVPHPPLPPLANPHLRLPPWHQQPPHFMLLRGGSGNGNVPPPPMPPVEAATAAIIPKPCNSIDNPQADIMRSITIDGLSKEIRIYDQVAIVFMEQDQPREIGFQAGQRSIIIDNQPPLALQFNDDYCAIKIDGEPARIRFGFPSRELYIDEHWYEIYFGGPAVSIPLRQRLHTIKAEGPPPQVNIGSLRHDLVIGKINMIVDAYIIVPLFLDARAQCFRLGDQEHTLQFADQLATVLLDGEPTRVEYGGLPKSLMLGGKKYFVRFGALPQGVVAGKVKIRDMVYVNMEKPLELDPELTKILQKEEIATTAAELILATVAQNPTVAEVEKSEEKTLQTTTSVESAPSATSSVAAIPNLPVAAAMNNINIDELFQKLVSSGILGGNKTAVAAPAMSIKSSTTPNALPVEIAITAPQQELIRPINLAISETIKTRQSAIVASLFSGLQCSSCGVRFPPEQTIKYSQHLDWHFRQNRRERDSSRKAHARKWYYDLNDWQQYEEIEDLEEREKNFFETQSNDAEGALEDVSASNQRGSPVPSCAATGPDDVDRACDMCHERFEQFYNEELDEWRLRSAIRVDAKIYHPLCYEDYKTSLNPPKAEETHTETINGDDDNAVDVIIKIEEDKADDEDAADPEKSSVTIADDDDDDDIIILPNEEPSVTEIDDDEEEYVPANITREEMGTDNDDTKTKAAAEGVHDPTAESDVEIQEPNIPFTDLDMYEEKELPEGGDDTSQLSFTNMKIKEEPKDDEEDEDDGFEDVGTVVISPEEEISIQSSEDTQSQMNDPAASLSAEPRPPSTTLLSDSAPLDSTTTEINATTDTVRADLNISMDDNLVEPEDEHNLSTAGPAPAIPLASLVNRIKINITKNNIISSTNSSSSNSATTTTTTTPCNNSLNCNESTTSTIPVLCSGSSGAATAANGDGNANVKPASSSVSSISVIGSYGSASSSLFHAQIPPAVVVATPAAAVSHLPTPPPAAPPVEESITYELKPALQKATLKKAKKVNAGVETSGLCSIM